MERGGGKRKKKPKKFFFSFFPSLSFSFLPAQKNTLLFVRAGREFTLQF
jgi:hypothetical protein